MHFHGALHLVWLDIREARTEVPPFHFLLYLLFLSISLFEFLHGVETGWRQWSCLREFTYMHP